MKKLSQDNNNDNTSNDLGTTVLEKDPEVKKPPSYQVILLNDEFYTNGICSFCSSDSFWTQPSKINRNNDDRSYKR